MKTEVYHNYTDSMEHFDEDHQKKLLSLIAKHLTCNKETQCKFTAALNAFTKLDINDKEKEIKVWIDMMEDIINDKK